MTSWWQIPIDGETPEEYLKTHGEITNDGQMAAVLSEFTGTDISVAAVRQKRQALGINKPKCGVKFIQSTRPKRNQPLIIHTDNALVITDVHADKSASGLTNGPDKEFANRFLKSLTYFSTTFKTPFILDAGDTVTEINNFPMFLIIAELSAIKIYSTPGNHDYSIADISSNNLVKKKKLVFDYFGYRFIGIDSLNVDFSWLDNELAAGRQAGKKIILFGHLPVKWPTQLTHQIINMEYTVR